jgi:ankyrin repeat protein
MRTTAIIFLIAACASLAAESPLADAAQKLDRPRIKSLLAHHTDVNAPQTDGMTALHWAAHLDDLETTERLLQAGANAKATNRYGVTPLSLACVNGNPAIVKLLLDAGADPNITLRGGETALMTAARTGRPGPVKTLLVAGADVNAKERRGQTALMWAAADGHAEVVQLLIDAGADFRAPLDSGFTPLLFAVREGRLNVVCTLLKAGADLNSAMETRKSGPKGPKSGITPLILAVENGHFELAAELLKAGADPNDQRSDFTALHNITWVRKPNRGDGDDGDPAPAGSGNLTSLQFVRKLVEHGADVNARLKKGNAGKGQLSKRGATPFFLAAITDDVPLMRVLLELGADPLLPNADGATPLMAAAGLGTPAPGEEAGTEEEALHAVQLAIELPKVVQLLADKGAKVDVWNRTNRWGWTPLHIATGYRAGNFKPSPDTVAALHRAMLAAGVSPPATVSPPPNAGPDYAPVVEPKKRVP